MVGHEVFDPKEWSRGANVFSLGFTENAFVSPTPAYICVCSLAFKDS